MLTTPLVSSGLARDVTTSRAFTFQTALQAIQNGQSTSQAVQRLLSELTKNERLRLLDGDDQFYNGLKVILCDRYNRVPFVHGCIPRLEIPGIRFTDGPWGIVMGASTAFPVSMARGATWDVALEERIGNAIGKEAKAQGANYFAGVCINLPRHPAWGRIQETYGEDPVILGEFGAALTTGVQNHVMAFEESVLHEVFLPHFKRVVEAGVASVMSSYNSVNGEWAGQNRELLSDILRRQWGFDGFVLSDFIFGLRDAALSVKNGLDIEAPFTQQRGIHLKAAIDSGELASSYVDTACARILRKELEFAKSTEKSQPDPSVVFCDEHRKLAREAAARSVVLLKNDPVSGAPLLPLNVSKISKVAVVGRLANAPNTGDKGSSQVFSPAVVTPFEGLKTALPHAEIVLENSDSPERAGKAAALADLVICIVGYNATDEGEYVVPSLKHDPCLLDLFPPAVTAEQKETLAMIKGSENEQKLDTGLEVGAGGDRKSLRLRKEDVAMIKAVQAANSRTVVSIVAAGAIIIEEWRDSVPAILMSWYAGSEGGHGLADILLGDMDASGRLPFSIPRDESHLPFYETDTTEITYDRWFGQSLLDRLGEEAAFPLGFGISYTSFSVSDLRIVACKQDSLTLHFVVENTGVRDGRYVAQVYGLPEVPDFPSRVLLGFAVVDLAAGEKRKVVMKASSRPLQRWVEGKFITPGKEVDIEVAAFSGDSQAAHTLCFLW
ncbi:hypothetical protein LZ554_000529 [Drepanopeziza brunnea f. sp. 'monogermtubi']|nr:hypothetical protein LZ554_000529 [Drepanopeziza brunnea f. sp. 'monogermtubi']